jgi:hypothetical protein
MLKAINDRNPEHNARDWLVTLLDSVGFPTSSASPKERGESKPKPLWRRFDDTHHWDSTAEEWVPNDPK